MVRVGIPTPYTTSSAQANSESFLERYQVLASLALQNLGTKFWRIHYQILVISLGAPQIVGSFVRAGRALGGRLASALRRMHDALEPTAWLCVQ